MNLFYSPGPKHDSLTQWQKENYNQLLFVGQQLGKQWLKEQTDPKVKASCKQTYACVCVCLNTAFSCSEDHICLVCHSDFLLACHHV